MYPSKHDRLPRDTRAPPRTVQKLQWSDEIFDGFPAVHVEHPPHPCHMLDEQGFNLEGFRELIDALEKHRRSAPLTRIRYYSPQEQESPTAADINNDSKLSPKAAHPDSIYPSHYESTIAFFSPSEPTRDIPDNWISDDEDAGLPGTKDLRDFSVKKAERIVHAHIQGDFDDFQRKEKWRKGHPRSHSVEAAHEVGRDGIFSALFHLYRNHEARASVSTMPIRQLPSNGYHTQPDKHEDFRFMSKSSKQETADTNRERVHERKSLHFDTPFTFGYISRPAVGRGAGGVFGPLIASISNLAMIGAPHASLVRPNVKWRGQGLSRSSVESKDTIRASPENQKNTVEHDN